MKENSDYQNISIISFLCIKKYFYTHLICQKLTSGKIKHFYSIKC